MPEIKKHKTTDTFEKYLKYNLPEDTHYKLNKSPLDPFYDSHDLYDLKISKTKEAASIMGNTISIYKPGVMTQIISKAKEYEKITGNTVEIFEHEHIGFEKPIAFARQATNAFLPIWILLIILGCVAFSFILSSWQ